MQVLEVCIYIYICELAPELEVHMFAYSSLQLVVLICIVLYMNPHWLEPESINQCCSQILPHSYNSTNIRAFILLEWRDNFFSFKKTQTLTTHYEHLQEIEPTQHPQTPPTQHTDTDQGRNITILLFSFFVVNNKRNYKSKEGTSLLLYCHTRNPLSFFLPFLLI